MKAAPSEQSWHALKQDTESAQFEQLKDLARDIAEDRVRTETVYAILHLLGNRWGALILLVLATGHLRYAGLRRALLVLSGEMRITPRVLTLKLRELEQHGLIDRSVSDDVPPKVDYRLTANGRELTQHARAIMEWVQNARPEASVGRARASGPAKSPKP